MFIFRLSFCGPGKGFYRCLKLSLIICKLSTFLFLQCFFCITVVVVVVFYFAFPWNRFVNCLFLHSAVSFLSFFYLFRCFLLGKFFVILIDSYLSVDLKPSFSHRLTFFRIWAVWRVVHSYVTCIHYYYFTLVYIFFS